MVNLSGAHLEGTDVSEAILRMANLVEANLSGAHLEDADLSQADLRVDAKTTAHLESDINH